MRIAIVAAALLLAGCGGSVVPPPRSAGYVPVPSAGPVPPSVSAIRGQTAQRLVAQFGAPSLDVSEGTGRKLQFAGPICVLDAYLYAPNGRGEPVAVHIDTRQRNGSAIDQSSCISSLTRRVNMR